MSPISKARQMGRIGNRPTIVATNLQPDLVFDSNANRGVIRQSK